MAEAGGWDAGPSVSASLEDQRFVAPFADLFADSFADLFAYVAPQRSARPSADCFHKENPMLMYFKIDFH